MPKKPIDYSQLEAKLLAMLSYDEGIDTVTLGHTLYADHLNGRKIVLGALKNLEWKIDKRNEPFRLARTPRCGPRSVLFWLELR